MSDTNQLRVDPGLLPALNELAPGVVGYTMDDEDGALRIPLVVATDQGHGDVGRYLDSLPQDRVIRVPNVISGRLAGMLQRRGFRAAFDRGNSECVCWERRP